MLIRDVGRIASAPGSVARSRGGEGFAVGGGPDQAAGPAAASAAAGLDGLLLLQEGEGGPVRDRRARQHGRAVLEALARLQLGLLDGEGTADCLATLAALVEHGPEAADPGLRDVLAAVGLRARVELARHAV